MSWTVEKTESFKKWWKKEKIDDGNYKPHERALKEFRNITLPHNQQTSIFKNASFECWVSRLPDKVRKQGKRGGFRVVFILDIEESILKLQGIFRKKHLRWKEQKGKHDEAFEVLLKDLAQAYVHIE